MLLHFRFYISTVVNSLHWPFSTVNAGERNSSLWFFVSLLLSVRVSIYSFRLPLPWNSPRSSWKNIAFTLSAAVQFGVWASFLCYHYIEITSSSKIISALYYQSLSVYNYSAKANDSAIGTFPSQRPFHWFLSSKQSQQYSSPTSHTGDNYSPLTFLRSFSVHIFSKPTNQLPLRSHSIR